MKAALIINPAARLVKSKVPVKDVEEGLREAGLDLEVHETLKEGHGIDLAHEAVARGLPRVVAAGGDGTINEVVQGLAGSQTELAIVPLGTGNVVARYAGLSETKLEEAYEVAASGMVKTVDLGLMGERYFLAMAGAGIDATVAAGLDSRWKQMAGKLSYLTEFFRAMVSEEPHTFSVRVGDRHVTGPMWGVLICNTNEFTWRIHPAPEAREDDGLLDVVFIHRKGFLDVMNLAARMFFSGEDAIGHSAATVLRVGEMSISSEPPVPWEVDGDVRGETPVEVKVVPGALRIVVPKDSDAAQAGGEK